MLLGIQGDTLYQKSFGKVSLKEGRDEAFTSSTICAIASMTKLMTAVAAMQCVEQGKLDLDKDVRPLLPEIGRYGIMTGFDDDKNLAIFEDDSTPITLRMLLCHTSGHEYDWFNPLLGKWRASRNEVPWSGAALTDKCAIPLVFTPGTNFAYGASSDWAGRLVEVASGVSLEEYMHKHVVSLSFRALPTLRQVTKDGTTDAFDNGFLAALEASSRSHHGDVKELTGSFS